jgi:hypothetical protein
LVDDLKASEFQYNFLNHLEQKQAVGYRGD